MSSTINEIFNAALLSQATYAEGLRAGLSGLNLKNVFKTVSDVTDAQAEYLASNYRVVAQQATTETGFSATLFQNIHTPEYHLSMRGTDGFAGDVPENIYNINTGISPRQNVDMINFYLRLMSGTSVDVPQFKYQRVTSFEVPNQPYIEIVPPTGAIDEPESIPGVYSIVALEGTQKGLGHLSTNPDINVTGHSLGGHLASAFTVYFPSIIKNTVTIDSAGFIGNSFQEFASLIVQSINATGFTNIQPSFNPSGLVSDVAAIYDPVSSSLIGTSHLSGNLQQVEVEVAEPLIPFTSLASHFSDNIVDSLAALNFISQLDESITIQKYNELFLVADHDVENSIEGLLNNFAKIKDIDQIENNIGSDDNNDNAYELINELNVAFGLVDANGQINQSALDQFRRNQWGQSN